MTQWHMKSKRKPSGGLRHSINRCTKKLAWRGRNPTETVVADEDEREILRTRGGKTKVVLSAAAQASVIDPKTNEMRKAKVLGVVENKANRDYIRRNIITKGAIIEVQVDDETKQALVTSRPGRDGVVHAKIIEAA